MDKILNLIRYHPLFTADDDKLNYHEYRELTFNRLKEIINLNIIDVEGIFENTDVFLGIMDTLNMYDPSLAIKTGVNFGLFGAGLKNFGNPDQVNDYINMLNKGKIFGCLAITEIGHGSNLKALETLATWDNTLNEFIINSPTYTSQKCWIGNATCHGTHAIVFANLVYNNVNEGLHPFLVKIRDNGAVCENVYIEDNGVKKGLNGVDNGIIRFDNLRIPRENLLDKFGYVDDKGNYITDYTDENSRFGQLLSTLTGGRGTLASGANAITRRVLALSTMYSLQRRQFSGKDNIEKPLIWYKTHYTRLIPLIIRSIMYDHVLKYMMVKGVEEYKQTGTVSKKNHMLASTLKILCSEHAEESCRVARMACGGNGYSMKNKISKLHNDVTVWQTFEGDNTVLRQEICKNMFKFFADNAGKGALKILYFLRLHIQKKLITSQYVIGSKIDIDDPSDIYHILQERELILKLDIATNLIYLIEILNTDPFHAWNSNLDRLMNLSNIYMEKKVLGILLKNKRLIGNDMLKLYVYDLIERDSFGFISDNIFNANDIRYAINIKNKLCKKYSSKSIIDKLINMLNVDHHLLKVPMLSIRSKL